MKVYLLMNRSYDYDLHNDFVSAHATHESAMKYGEEGGTVCFATEEELDKKKGNVEAYYVREEEVKP